METYSGNFWSVKHHGGWPLTTGQFSISHFFIFGPVLEFHWSPNAKTVNKCKKRPKSDWSLGGFWRASELKWLRGGSPEGFRGVWRGSLDKPNKMASQGSKSGNKFFNIESNLKNWMRSRVSGVGWINSLDMKLQAKIGRLKCQQKRGWAKVDPLFCHK